MLFQKIVRKPFYLSNLVVRRSSGNPEGAGFESQQDMT